MANFLKNNANTRSVSERDLLLSKYHSGRHNLLLVVLFTAINVIFLLTESYTYFLFSASMPYVAVTLGMEFCGKFPAEYYYDVYGAGPEELDFMDSTVFVFALIIAFTIIALYLISWFMAKKPRVGFMIFGLVLFVIDTGLMFWAYGFSVENILDIIFHGWVIISLVNGIIAYYKLKKLPPEEVVVEAEAAATEAPAQTVSTLNGENIDESK